MVSTEQNSTCRKQGCGIQWVTRKICFLLATDLKNQYTRSFEVQIKSLFAKFYKRREGLMLLVDFKINRKGY